MGILRIQLRESCCTFSFGFSEDICVVHIHLCLELLQGVLILRIILFPRVPPHSLPLPKVQRVRSHCNLYVSKETQHQKDVCCKGELGFEIYQGDFSLENSSKYEET